MEARLGSITVRELSRSPGKVLARVRAGERLIVCSHGRPVATLQPLDGIVAQPFADRADDTYGEELLDPDGELDKLSDAQRHLLHMGLRGDQLGPARVGFITDWGELKAGIEDLKVRGFARWSERGLVITGRGMILHERLAARFGPPEAMRVRLARELSDRRKRGHI